MGVSVADQRPPTREIELESLTCHQSGQVRNGIPELNGIEFKNRTYKDN